MALLSDTGGAATPARAPAAAPAPDAAPPPAPRARPGRRPPAHRHDDLLPVGDLRREVDRVGVAAPGRAARTADRVAHARVAVQAEDARVAHRARDVHERVGRRRALEADVARRAAAGRGTAARAPSAPELAPDPAGAWAWIHRTPSTTTTRTAAAAAASCARGSSGTAATLRGAL